MRALTASMRVLAVVLAGALPPLAASAAPAPPEREPAADTAPKVRDALECVVSLKIDKQSLARPSPCCTTGRGSISWWTPRPFSRRASTPTSRRSRCRPT